MLEPLTVTDGPGWPGEPDGLEVGDGLLGGGGATSATTSTRSVPTFCSCATISRRREPTWA